MTLSPGTRLGVYEVVAQIGVGGMGEVYRATDTNLKRQVAIKVLPASVAGDAERLARFQREAEVLASLNHPNIAQIYGFEKSSGVHALVMELVEGPTLAERIAGPAPQGPSPKPQVPRHGAIPIDEALAIARQIADALEAAHERGIVHRDLKPANVKVRMDGVVKVLDFGLAKALAPDPVADSSNSPTLSLAAVSWSADGRFLLYIGVDPQANTDIWVVPMVSDCPSTGSARSSGRPELVEGRTPSVFLKTPFREAYGEFSPDGRWVAYHSNESGRPEIYVRPFVPPMVPPGAAGTGAGAERSVRLQPDLAGGQWQVSTAGGIHPAWRPDGKELYYLNPAGAMMAAPITVSASTLEPGAPVVLFPTRIFGGGVDVQQGRQYHVAPDGRFLINTELDSAGAPITLLQNWQPEATR